MVRSWRSALTRRSVRLSSLVTGLVLSSLSIFPVMTAIDTLEQYPGYLRWARVWDERDPEYRYNNCAEWYYDLDRLSANLPGWDT
jgi:hypothetical protein